jgi:Zn-dependent protease with chaperone function
VSPSAGAARRWSAQLYALVVALGAGGLLAAGFSLATGIGRVSVDRHSPRELHVLGLTLSYPYANAPAILLVALAAVGALVLAGGARATARLLAGQRRFQRRLGAMALRQERDALVFDDSAPQAFCAGLLRPRIYLSSGAVAALDPGALDAVVEHERRHRDRRDPLRVLLATVLSEALFFLPVVSRLRDRFVTVLELDADDAAIAAAGGDPAALAAAMVLFDASASPAGAVGIAPERVDHLLGRPAPWRLPIRQVVIGALTLTAVLVACWAAGQHAVVRTTLAVPGLSRQPCVLVLASIPGLLAATTIAWLRHRTSARLGGLDQPRH